jgi:hypothetical protein
LPGGETLHACHAFETAAPGRNDDRENVGYKGGRTSEGRRNDR